MSNKKVYLAKHILAGGFDVEYVKSSLLRIPGIDIVEFGMGIEPKECVSFVIVPAVGTIDDDEASVFLSRNVSKELKNYYKSGNSSDSVYIFAGTELSIDSEDAEKETLLVLSPLDEDITIDDKDNFNQYAYLDLAEQEGFLDNVSLDIGVTSYLWKTNPRHPQPKPEYAMPPVPSIEERRLKKSPILDEVGTWASHNDYWSARPCIVDFSQGDRRLLLLRRK
jgi:hypothetical protein